MKTEIDTHNLFISNTHIEELQNFKRGIITEDDPYSLKKNIEIKKERGEYENWK